MSAKNSLQSISTLKDYQAFEQINGDHPFKKRVPGAYVEYGARRREGGKLLYFNFNLAKEMGLIHAKHPHEINKALEEKVLDTFSLFIINEYDLLNAAKIDPKTILPRKYMATRYLQLQHPGNLGLTSGDGRSIWNGLVRDKSQHLWDITSCGTGATCLSPATVKYGRFFETGDPEISYGCGMAETQEGLSTAIMSEIYHRKGIPTERCLAIIEYDKGISINVRAGKNLLRPSHLFNHLKQENYDALKNAVDYYIDRQLTNGVWGDQKKIKNVYDTLLEKVAKNFAKMAALFETEYIFCWMDWDGDNILMDGGIIDYGSIRQFGLFHYEYRYDDDDRWSTNLLEQKGKARYTVQTFAQLVHFLKTKKKRNIKEFGKHKILKQFDEEFIKYRHYYFLYKLGLTPAQTQLLVDKKPTFLKSFIKAFQYFERCTSTQGPRKVPDGVTTDAIFCMRDILRELPPWLLKNKSLMREEQFIDIMRSQYAKEQDLKLNSYRKEKIKEFQENYIRIMKYLARHEGKTLPTLLKAVDRRSQVINRYERLTGDAVVHIAQKIFDEKKSMTQNQVQRMMEDFISENLDQDQTHRNGHKTSCEVQKVKKQLLKIVKENSEGI